MAYKVTKRIPTGDGSFIAVGDIVDGASWRNLRALISNRYLMPLSEVPVVVEKVEESKPKVKAPSATK